MGILFHVTDKIAIRPEFNIAQSSTDFEGPVVIGSSDSWEIGTGISALFYVRAWDDLHLYVSPRWTYSHGSASSELSDSTAASWGLAGSVGAQYTLGKRFGIFGEVGVGYQHSRLTGPVPIQAGFTGHSVGTRSGVGVILYFK